MTATVWIDKQGDVWRLGDDGLMHTPETAPFSREHVEKKWGPLREVVPDPTVKEVHPNDCPECQQGKHRNCLGTAWDDELDAPVPCECAEGGHL